MIVIGFLVELNDSSIAFTIFVLNVLEDFKTENNLDQLNKQVVGEDDSHIITDYFYGVEVPL